MATRSWTPDQRQAQAERIKAVRPWERSTGPRTVEGKQVASKNAWKGGSREMLRAVARALRAHQQSRIA